MSIKSYFTKYKKGYKEALMAVVGGLIVIGILAGIATLLSGCAGTQLGARYTHHSSIPVYHDPHESNMVGPVLSVPVCGRKHEFSEWCPTVEFSAQWDVRHGEHNHPYGSDPVGTINITQPIWIKK